MKCDRWNNDEAMRRNDQLRDEWDPITSTPGGSVIWRRYRDRRIVTARIDETPQEALERSERGTQ